MKMDDQKNNIKGPKPPLFPKPKHVPPGCKHKVTSIKYFNIVSFKNENTDGSSSEVSNNSLLQSKKLYHQNGLFQNLTPEYNNESLFEKHSFTSYIPTENDSKNTESVTSKNTESVTSENNESITSENNESITSENTESITSENTESVTIENIVSVTSVHTKNVTSSNTVSETSKNTGSITSEYTENLTTKNTESVASKNTGSVIGDYKAYLKAKELMTSEQIYIDALKLIVIDFKKYIDECNIKLNSIIIPPNELEKIFATLPQLLGFNEDLLNDLTLRIENWNEGKGVADVIVRKGPFLKLYTTYMKDFECQCNYMDECCLKYPKFSNALKEYERSTVCKNLTLKHYMLKPIQRIPHYRLLLEGYLDHLSKESIEYRVTETALNIIKDVLHHANSSLKSADNFCKLYQIQTNLGNYEIIKPGRRFIKEGELKKLSRKEIQARFIILLSDCLLYIIYSTSAGLKLKYELPLSGMKVKPHNVSLGDTKEFSIITNTRSFTLRAKSSEECEEWVNVLTMAIKENNCRQLTFFNKACSLDITNPNSSKLGRQAPIWLQDKSTTMCLICTAEFTVTFRRHHCRCCGKVVCGDCSNNKAPLPYLKFKSERVCDKCYKYLLEEFEDPQNELNELIKKELRDEEIENLKFSFKKMDSVKRVKKYVPPRLKEVTANDSGSSMSGWLYRKHRKDWKRMWFVLKDQVLYMYKASNDVVAHDSLPVLGYVIDRTVEVEDMDTSLIFRLTHAGQTPFVFLAPDKQFADVWVKALTEASVLK